MQSRKLQKLSQKTDFLVYSKRFFIYTLLCLLSYAIFFCQLKDLMKVHNSGKFHKYSIYGCKVKNFHMFLGPYSFISGPILLKFKLEVVFLQTKTVFKELCTFGPALRPCYTLKMSEILLFSRNKFTDWALQMCQDHGPIFSPLPRKNTITFCTIWITFGRKLGQVTHSRVKIKI